jgi:hypothetical protein
MGLFDSSPEPPTPAADTPRRELPSDLFRPVPPAVEDPPPDALDSITRRLRSETGEPTAPVAKRSPAAVVVTWVRSHTQMIAVVAAIAGLAVATFFAWPYLTSGAASVQASLVAAISNAPPPGTEEPAAAPPETPPPARARTRRRPAAAAVAESQPEVVSEAGAAPDVAPAAPVAAAVTADSVSSDSSSLAAAQSQPVAPREPAPLREPVVYSSANRDVQPPKVTSAEIPRTIGGGLPTRTESLELVVNADGTVGRVRLTTPNPRMLDPMFLSRAKMWKFEPARRDGEAVP